MNVTRRWAVELFVCVSMLAGFASSAFAQLPAPWANRDIGSPSVAGSAAESAGTFTVRGGGIDIWYASDQFQFVSQTITGDVDVRAQVRAVQYINQWTKAGVMIRETLASSSRHASTFVTPAKGLAFQRRVTAGADSIHTPGPFATAPYWVRMVRAGQLFSSYVSADGGSWQLIGTETIAMGASVQVGLAVTSHDPSQSAMATFTNVTVSTTSSAPQTAWANRDIGSPLLAGRASESNGIFSVTGAGADIWGSSDQFQFMYQQANGDLEIVARLNELGSADAWSKAGVMIRESLSASAAHAFMTGSAAKGWAFQRRPLSGSISVNSPGSFSTPPGWLRLVRKGDLFSAYESSNGTTWWIVGTETIPMSSSVYVGLAVTSHNPNMTATGTFTNVAIRRTTTSTNASPTITLLAPANGTTYSAPASITFSASAADTDGTVTKVNFYANGVIAATDTTTPFSATWGSVAAGTYNLNAVATDDKGATAASATATVIVQGAAGQRTTLLFAPSVDHATSVTSYSVALRRSTDGVSATPVASKNVGKPSPFNNEIIVDISDIVSPLAAGSYYAVVTAIGPGGSAASAPSATFTK